MKLMTLYGRPDASSTADANHARLATAGDFLTVYPDARPNRLVLDLVTPLRGRDLDHIGADAIEGGDDQVHAWRRHLEVSTEGSHTTVAVAERVLLGHEELFEGAHRRRQTDGAVKVVAFLVRRPELTTEEFARYWEDRHAPLAMEIVPEECFGYAYVQNHALSTSRFDGVVEMYFRDHDHVARWAGWFNGEEGARLRRDEYEFMLPNERVVLVTDEHVLHP